jgi:hypothetical protein
MPLVQVVVLEALIACSTVPFIRVLAVMIPLVIKQETFLDFSLTIWALDHRLQVFIVNMYDQ